MDLLELGMDMVKTADVLRENCGPARNGPDPCDLVLARSHGDGPAALALGELFEQVADGVAPDGLRLSCGEVGFAVEVDDAQVKGDLRKGFIEPDHGRNEPEVE